MDPEDFTLTPEEQAALDAAINGGSGGTPQPGGIPSWLQDAPNGRQAAGAQLAGVPEWLSTRYAQSLKEYKDAWDEYQQTPPEQRSFTGVADRVKLAQSNISGLEKQISAYRPKQSTTNDAQNRLYNAQAAKTEAETLRAASDALWQREQARISNALAERRLSLEEANAEAQRVHDQIVARLQAQTNAINQRGQNMDMATSMAKVGTDAAMQGLQYMAPAGTAAMLTQSMRGLNPNAAALPAQAFPFDPAQMPEQIAARILKGMSPTADAILASGGPQPQGTGFTLPAMIPPPEELQAPTFGGQ